MADVDLEHPELPPELEAHWRKIASPANVALTASRGEWLPAWHLKVMNRAVVNALTDPEQSFLNIQVSVRHGKSQLADIWTVVWYLGVFASKRVLITCATADLAETFSQQARDIFKEWGPILFGKSVRDDKSAVDEWGTSDNGVVIAAGVRGMIQGKGFDLIVIDDPIGSADEAHSETVKAKMVSWYSSSLRPRLEPGGTILFIMARWSDDDLTGVVVEKALKEGRGDPWVVIKMAAIAEAPPHMRELDPELTDEERAESQRLLAEWTDEWGRHDGEALWPERWPAKVLLQLREGFPDPTTWDSLYQQDPTPKTGNDFERLKWGVYINLGDEHALGIQSKCRGWDIAGSHKKGDYTVGALMARTHDRRTVILDIIRGRWAPDRVEEEVLIAADRDGLPVRIRMELPKGDSGVTELHYGNLLVHRDFEGWPVKGDKEVRASIMSGAHRRGRLKVVDAPWTEALVAEFERFPNGRHDDQVDGCSLGFNTLWGTSGETSIYIPDAKYSIGLNGARFDPDEVVIQQGSLPPPAEAEVILL